MAVPAFEEFLRPVLEEISKSDGPITSARKALIQPVVERLGLSDADCNERLGSGQSRVSNRVAWSVTYISKAGLITQPSRGTVLISDDGRRFLAEHRGGRITRNDLLKYPSFVECVRGTRGFADAPAPQASDPSAIASEDPEEQLYTALGVIRAKVADDLRAALAAIDPTDFEELVLDLMRGLGYGDQQGEFTRTGGSGDFGIDGIVRSDRIGLEKIYLQAKRWQGPVGRKEIQAFFGSLAGLKATKGVFIKTSRFTPDALEYAENVSSTLILIDGARLVELMTEAEVGVRKKRVITVPEFDSDYFES
jgi:restriction system protein